MHVKFYLNASIVDRYAILSLQIFGYFPHFSLSGITQIKYQMILLIFVSKIFKICVFKKWKFPFPSQLKETTPTQLKNWNIRGVLRHYVKGMCLNYSLWGKPWSAGAAGWTEQDRAVPAGRPWTPPSWRWPWGGRGSSPAGSSGSRSVGSRRGPAISCRRRSAARSRAGGPASLCPLILERRKSLFEAVSCWNTEHFWNYTNT